MFDYHKKNWNDSNVSDSLEDQEIPKQNLKGLNIDSYGEIIMDDDDEDFVYKDECLLVG